MDPQSNHLQLQRAGEMGDVNHRAATTSRMGLRHSGGEIVEVQGGHIVRSIGRKDRHSKVCTAKGPRDRRVRLSAHTAIQFYDVQDRLGYDRPSKAVDWLITKAKSAIDELAELPPWKPTATTSTTAKQNNNQEDEKNIVTTIDNENPYLVSDTRGRVAEENPNTNNSGFLPPSFFPVGASSETPSSSLQFQNYPPDFLSRTGSHSQDLRLSLQSFPEPILLPHQDHQQAAAQAQAHQSEPVIFTGASSLACFDGSSAGWEHNHHQQQHHAEMGKFQRLVAWNSSGGGGGTGDGGIGGFLFGNPLPQQPVSSAYGGQNSQFYSERGPLQSNNMPFVRAWIDQPIPTNHHQIPKNFHHHQAALFSGFHIPARFQGEEEEHDSIHNKLSSASSDSHH